MNSKTERSVIHQGKIDPKISAPKIAASTSNTLGRSVSAETDYLKQMAPPSFEKRIYSWLRILIFGDIFLKYSRQLKLCCQVIYSQFGLAIHQNDHQARRRFVKWAQNEIAVVPDFHKRILFNDEAHFWLNGYVNKQNCRIWSEANPQGHVETPLHPEKLTVWCALWAGGILLQKR
ncbi:hypothetical protein TNCV_324261 [Trichonephila clavipes]|nr:hypothetical protein TNCV_324261 [Trichonephila clavipes]